MPDAFEISPAAICANRFLASEIRVECVNLAVSRRGGGEVGSYRRSYVRSLFFMSLVWGSWWVSFCGIWTSSDGSVRVQVLLFTWVIYYLIHVGCCRSGTTTITILLLLLLLLVQLAVVPLRKFTISTTTTSVIFITSKTVTTIVVITTSKTQ